MNDLNLKWRREEEKRRGKWKKKKKRRGEERDKLIHLYAFSIIYN